MRLALLTLILLCCSGLLRAEPLTLVEAGLRSLGNHPDIRLAESRIKASQARAGRAQAPFFPKIDTTFSVQDVANDNGTPNEPLRFRPPNDYLARLRASQILTDFGERRARARSADLLALAAQHLGEETLQQRLLSVGLAYFNLNLAQQLVHLERRNLALTAERLEDAKKARLAGACTPDEAVTEADQSVAKRQVLEAINREGLARVELATAMGENLPFQGELQNCLLAKPQEKLEEMLREGLERAPELQAARARTDSAQADLKASKASYFPEVSINADYGFYSSTYPLGLRSWRVGLDLSVPIFNEPFLSQSVALSESELAAAQAIKDQVELNVHSEIQRNNINVDMALQRVRQSDRASEQSFLTFVEVWSFYRNGSGTCRDVSLAQRDYFSARRNQIRTEFELQSAILNLYRSAGLLDASILETTVDATRFRRQVRGVN